MSIRKLTTQLGAEAPVNTISVNRTDANRFLAAAKSGGRVSDVELQSQIAKPLADGIAEVYDAAKDARRHVFVNNGRVRFTDASKRTWTAFRSVPARPVGGKLGVLEEGELKSRVSTELQKWYRTEVEVRINDVINDPSRTDYSSVKQAADRALADNADTFSWDASQILGVRYDVNLGAKFLGDRANQPFPYEDENGRMIPLEDVAFIEFSYQPDYAGIQLTSWFAFDKRTGGMLEHFDTQG